MKPAGVAAVVALGIGALGALVLAGHFGHKLPSPGSSLLWFAIPLAGATLICGRDVLDELGLKAVSVPGLAVVLLGSVPMGLGMLWEGSEPAFDPSAMWRGAWRAGLVEEFAFRGFAFGMLYWRARWSFVAAMLTTAVVFGGFHLPMAYFGGHLDQAWGAALLTGAGGGWYAWLYVRWNRSLWVPIATHAAMNSWWVLFTAGPTAAGGGPGAMWGRVAAIIVISIATAKLTKQAPAPG